MNDSRHGTPPAPPEPDSVCLPGPWRHRLVSTNGIHLHTADLLPHNWEETHPPNELPPLVLLIHGYGENWWTWHNQLVPLSRAGYHAMAVDLRGYGDSDKPPRGYDLTTAANDMAGLVRATGHRNVTVVGHGLGGTVGWTMARMFRSGVTTLIAVDAPHPLTQRIDYMKQAFTHATTVGPFLSAQNRVCPNGVCSNPTGLRTTLATAHTTIGSIPQRGKKHSTFSATRFALDTYPTAQTNTSVGWDAPVYALTESATTEK